MPHSTSTAFNRSAAPPSVDAWIAAVAARQHALITFVQLLRVLTPGAITHRVKRGLLHRRYRGVYVVGQPTLSREGEWLAAALACGGALGYLSCGALHGVSRFGEPMIEVVTTSRARPEGVRVHTVRRLDPRELTSHKGIPATTIHRLLVDLTDETDAASGRQRHPQGGVPRALRRARGARRDGAGERPSQAARARAGDRTAPDGQRGHAERRRGRLPAARRAGAAGEHGAARLRGRLPLARSAAGGRGRRCRSTRCAPTPTRRATVHSTPPAGPSCASATARSTSARRASRPRSRLTA